MIPRTNNRYTEIDIARGLAIAGMVLYHTAYDLSQLYSWDIAVFEGIWKLLARGTAILFLLLVGISFAIAWEKHKDRAQKGALLRALEIFGCALLVSAVTYLIDPETYIRFGILHCIAIATAGMVAGRRFLPETYNCTSLLAGIALIIAGQLPATITANTSLLLPFGITYPGFATVDYYPLIPWFGVVLIGHAIGHHFYVRSTGWRKKFSILHSPFSILSWPGRHSLLIYLAHQPIIIGILWLIMGTPTNG